MGFCLSKERNSRAQELARDTAVVVSDLDTSRRGCRVIKKEESISINELPNHK